MSRARRYGSAGRRRRGRSPARPPRGRRQGRARARPVRSRPRTPAWSSASPHGTSGRALRRDGGSAVARTAYRPKRSFSLNDPVRWLSERPSVTGSAPRVGEDGVVAVRGDDEAGIEGHQVERLKVDEPAQRRVGGVEQLEAAVEEELVDRVGADPTAHAVGCLEHDDVVSGCVQIDGAAESCETAPTITASWMVPSAPEPLTCPPDLRAVHPSFPTAAIPAAASRAELRHHSASCSSPERTICR